MLEDVLSDSQIRQGVETIVGEYVLNHETVYDEIINELLPKALSDVMSGIDNDKANFRAQHLKVKLDGVDTGQIHHKRKKTNSSLRSKLVFKSPARSEENQSDQNQLTVRRQSLCLVLDAGLHGIPFESMPILVSRSVSRMPSAILLAQLASTRKNVVDSQKTYYVLNPSKDLNATQRRFENSFTQQKGWTGIIGKNPSSSTYESAIKDKDVVIYCGHGAGQDFFKESQLRETPCNATMLLMGCSSGKLFGSGEVEPSGIALNYLAAGSPAVLANLWDVTDKDIDSVTMNILQTWGDKTGLLEALSSAREHCRMKYLNGAAPVVYGLDVRRRKEKD